METKTWAGLKFPGGGVMSGLELWERVGGQRSARPTFSWVGMALRAVRGFSQRHDWFRRLGRGESVFQFGEWEFQVAGSGFRLDELRPGNGDSKSGSGDSKLGNGESRRGFHELKPGIGESGLGNDKSGLGFDESRRGNDESGSGFDELEPGFAGWKRGFLEQVRLGGVFFGRAG